MSHSKLARDVVVGDRIWRASNFWLVASSEPSGENLWTFHLILGAQRAIWTYRADYDLAIADHRDPPVANYDADVN